MRFAELHLDRFGCFTDRRLAFRPDAALTVVYGPNEAGKSTALAAIADVLYGIEARSPFDFLHRYGDMRLGAAVAGPDGQLVFRRRKGNQNTLLDQNDAPLGDDALLPFLGGVDRALFLDAFGLDRERLRAGARRLIEGGGRIGESLLAAAPGLSSLIALRSTLAAEAEQLFPAGRKVSSRPFWQACERYAEARKRVRHDSLQAETVRAARTGLDEAKAAVSDLRQQQRTLRKELSRLRRLKTALPGLGRIEKWQAELAALGTVPEVEAAFTGRCRAALETRRELALDIERLDQESARARAELEGLAVDDALLGEAEAIDRLSEQRGAILKADQDLPKLEAGLGRVRRDLDEVARRLGLADGAAVVAARPSDSALARARTLRDQRRRLADRRQERKEAFAEVLEELDELERRRAALGHVADPAALRRDLDGLAGLSERMAARDELARSVAGREAELTESLQRLVVPVASAEELARLPVPHLASVEQAMERFDGLDKRRAELTAERQRLEASKDRVERRIGQLVADGEVPTAEAVSEARRARDTLWCSLRSLVLGEATPAERAAGDVEAYEAAVRHADQLADRRQAEADRIAEFRKLEGDRSEIAAGLADIDQALTALGAQLKACQADWNELWSPAGLTPKAPREMRAWLQARDDIVDLRLAIAADRARLAEADRSLEASLDRLRQHADGLGIVDRSGDAAGLLKSVSAAVAAMETRFHDARLIAERREACERERERLEAALSELDREATAWQAEWAQAAGAVGIRLEAGDEEAEAALAAWQAVPALAASLDDLAHRLARMREDRESFEEAARALAATVAADLAEAPPLSATAALKERLLTARQAATRRDSIASRLAELEERRAGRRSELELNLRELKDHCRHAGAGSWEALGPVVETIERGLELANRLAGERQGLIEACDGLGEADLRAELAGRDLDSLAARLQELEDTQEAMEDRMRAAIDAETRADVELKRLEAHAGAASAAQDEQNALAELADIIETWSGIAAAERLLAATIEAFRGQHQNPLLERASEAFAIATEGAFTGLSLDYDEADTHRIVALRPDGSRLAVDALSEGSADQLFLALRIATLEDHARRARPLPFIADDLFVTFDDTRTKAGLRLLAELGRTTQVIVFTHHQYVVEAARHALTGEVDTIDLG